MTATLKHVDAKQFYACKITSLLASHYNDNGSCACYPEEEKKMEFPMHPNDYPASLTRGDLEVRMRKAREALDAVDLDDVDHQISHHAGSLDKSYRHACGVIALAKKILDPEGTG